MQHYDEALAALDHALELDASMAFAWSHKADALRGVGREAEAQEADENSQALRAVGSLSASQYED
jgi:lipoprotein NlpI